MNWFLIINDEEYKKEFHQLFHQSSKGVLFKAEAEKLFPITEPASFIAEHKRNFITINTSNHLHVLKVDDIMHCESNQSYTRFHLINGKKITATKPLKQFESLLKQHRFFRIHQSHLVNANYIDKYIKGTGGYLILNDGTKLPVAARKKESLLRELEQL